MLPQPKLITDQETIDFFVNLEERDITKSFILDNFAEFDGVRKYNHWDIIEIPAGVYGPEGEKNKNSFKTTLGIWIWNKLFVEKELFSILKYVNKEIDGDEVGNINKILSYAVVEQKIPLEYLKHFIMKGQIIMRLVTAFSPSFTDNLLTIDDIIKDEKAKILEEYKDKLDTGDEVASAEVEAKLIALAKEKLKDDESLDVYLSGARGSIKNNFKNLFLYKGAYQKPDGSFKIIKSNYMNGISKEDYADVANSLVAGPYGRAKKTEVMGYVEKQFVSGYQHVITKHGTDCGTKNHIVIHLTKANIADYMYSYIIEPNGSLTELTSDNVDNYIGKTVKMRFSSRCEAEGYICNKCVGNLFNRLGLDTIGIQTAVAPSKLKNFSMKSFHDSTIKMAEMNVMEAFGFSE